MKDQSLPEKLWTLYKDIYKPLKSGDTEELYQNTFDHAFEKFIEIGDNLFQHLKRYLSARERKAWEIKEDFASFFPPGFKMVSKDQMFTENYAPKEKHKYGSDIVNALF
eukprot:CAMPEP_0170551312 /NCGR_PEP_ID=MMETSP0211-20121228/9336_1 /TAXON_ID=311385 /ORGANISM="Pseudokeronopsis sp., Strain OXSARD2" /LENGTH=108 /DNA_ID=CAMNT_0010858411 /DNA_START=806 /DNA_END=1132 /DNA_ORIENTATION=+